MKKGIAGDKSRQLKIPKISMKNIIFENKEFQHLSGKRGDNTKTKRHLFVKHWDWILQSFRYITREQVVEAGNLHPHSVTW